MYEETYAEYFKEQTDKIRTKYFPFADVFRSVMEEKKQD